MKNQNNTSIKFHIVFLAFSTLMIISIIFFFRIDNETNKSNLDLIHSYKWEVEETPIDIAHITIPKTFDPVLVEYSKLISADGFDLYQYRGKKAVRYTYKVLNHKDSGTKDIRINLIVCDKKIIAADLSSSSENGFVLPIGNGQGIK